MTNPTFKSMLFGGAMTALALFGAPVAKADTAATPAAPSIPAMMTPGAVAGANCETCPPMVNYKGGTAVINFVARVSDKTMAELARTAQNAVISGADRIRINISSQGGSVHAIQFAVNVLQNLSVPVETVAMSQIASAAVALYCAGEERYMANGSGLYLHQQRGYHEIQGKTAAAVVREYELNTRWYDELLHDCTAEDADRAMLDYSAHDVIINAEEAATLGMVTGTLDDLKDAKTWGMALNVVEPERPGAGAFTYPSFR